MFHLLKNYFYLTITEISRTTELISEEERYTWISMPGTLVPGCGLPEAQLHKAVSFTLLLELCSNGSIHQGNEAHVP